MYEVKELESEAKNVIDWVKTYVNNANAKGVIIGNSGGKDSACVIAIVVKALGKENVLTVAMPCSSIKQDLEDAKLVADTFEVPLIEVDLTKTFGELNNTIKQELKLKDILNDLSEESNINIRPRLRMTTLYAIAQSIEYLVIGTGNLCERMVGYTTKWGDSASDFNPIGNFTVEEVIQLGEYLGVPQRIIYKTPNDGLGDKTDEEKMEIYYEEISEYIKTGKTNEQAMKKIDSRYKESDHKRKQVPMYTPKNYMNKLDK